MPIYHRFPVDFLSILYWILESLFYDVLILVRHLIENIGFVKMVVFLQENNVFHGSEGGTDFKIDP